MWNCSRFCCGLHLLDNGNVCSVWLVTIPGQTGNCRTGENSGANSQEDSLKQEL